MSKATLYVDIDLDDDTMMTVCCTVSSGKFYKRYKLRKPDGTAFNSDDLWRFGSDSSWLAELIIAAIFRGEVDVLPKTKGGAE